MKSIRSLMLLALPGVLAAQGYKVDKVKITGDGTFDYVAVDPMGHVWISRSTHMMVVDGSNGKVLADFQTPGVHGAAFAPKSGHAFTTNGRDSTSSMIDLKNLSLMKQVHAGSAGLDGIMYDDATDKILTINHSRPIGTAVVIDAKTGDPVGKVELSDNAPEGGVSNGKDRIFINLEGKDAIDVVDTKSWKVVATWPTCEGPTGIAMDRTTNRIFSGCSKESAVLDATTGKIVAKIPNGDRVDALGWDQSQKLMYIPSGEGKVTIVHEDSPDKYTVVETVQTMSGARTIAVDPDKHIAYVFTVERGPSTPSATPGGRATPGPVTAAWLFAIHK